MTVHVNTRETLLWILRIGFVAFLLMAFAQMGRADETSPRHTTRTTRLDPYISVFGGFSTWDCTSNADCGVEAGEETYEVLGGELGYRFRDGLLGFRAGASLDWRRHQIHGLNGRACETDHAFANQFGVTYTSHRVPKCQTERNLQIWAVTADVWPTLQLWGDHVAVYAGGGIGVIVADGLGQTEAAPAVRFGVGVEARIHKGLFLDIGYRGLRALSDMRLSGYRLHAYNAYGPQFGLRWEIR